MNKPETPKSNAEKTFEHLFIESEQDGQNWKENYFRALIDNDQETLQILEEEAKKVGKIYKEDNEINNFISYFTFEPISYGDVFNKTFALKNLDNVEDIQFNIQNGILKIYTKEGYLPENLITVNMLSKSLPWLRDDDDIITSRRVGKCHHKSLELADELKFQLNINSSIVTGQISSLADKCRILHTWIELKIQGKPYVLDYTMNALIDKDAYYKIKHVKEKELSKIAYEDYMYDKPIIRPLLDSKELKYKQYLFFRDEIMRDLKKEDAKEPEKA